MGKISKYASIDKSVYVSPDVDLYVGDMTYIGPNVQIIGKGTVRFGDYCKIHEDCFINSAESYVKFGHNCWFGERTILDGTGGMEGHNNIGVGIASQLYTHIAHGDVLEGCRYFSKTPMLIEDDVWFVGQCLVSPIHAKKKSMAMLGSIVTKDMEENTIYAGVPARDITSSVGRPWTFRTAQEKYEMFHNLLEEFGDQFPDEKDQIIEHIIPCFEYPENIEACRTYFNVETRKYTKRSTQIERNFMKWLISYKGKFVPENKK